MDTQNTGQDKKLVGKVAVVTGASRGVGRGVACVLGEHGATVYVTGRTTEGDNGTIVETADLVTARGGQGIAVRVDHTDDAEVENLFAQVRQEQGRLDILINNVWDGYRNMENYSAPFWKQPIWRWDTMFDIGARAHFVASKFAVPLMLPHPGGLIVNTSYPDTPEPRPDGTHRDWAHIVCVAKGAVNDLTRLMAFSLHSHQIAVISVVPTGYVIGLDRMKKIQAALHTPGGIKALYQAEPPDGETSEYTGRAVAALATDPEVMARSGSVLPVDTLADTYGFTDIDGRTPRLCY
jgi:NAD(P)-dependent dehydrogenase (short-subunit alcohol dehydrogenase family)